MNIPRIKLSLKNTIKTNPLGKKARDLWQTRSFTKANAEKTFDEYFMYHFYNMPVSERRSYVSDRERITYWSV